MNNDINRLDESIRRILDELNMYDDQLRRQQIRQNYLDHPYHIPNYYPMHNPYYNPMYNPPFNSTNTMYSPNRRYSPHIPSSIFTPRPPPESHLRRNTRTNATRNRRTRSVFDSLLRNITNNTPNTNVESIEISISDLTSTPGEQNFSNVLNTNRGISIKNLREGSEVEINTTNGEICSICQDAIIDQQLIRKIHNCGHYFHIRCLERWLQENDKCPHCRTVVKAPETDEPNETDETENQNT